MFLNVNIKAQPNSETQVSNVMTIASISDFVSELVSVSLCDVPHRVRVVLTGGHVPCVQLKHAIDLIFHVKTVENMIPLSVAGCSIEHI